MVRIELITPNIYLHRTNPMHSYNKLSAWKTCLILKWADSIGGIGQSAISRLMMSTPEMVQSCLKFDVGIVYTGYMIHACKLRVFLSIHFCERVIYPQGGNNFNDVDKLSPQQAASCVVLFWKVTISDTTLTYTKAPKTTKNKV